MRRRQRRRWWVLVLGALAGAAIPVGLWFVARPVAP